jgi:predicted O-methyltransferase YrrM
MLYLAAKLALHACKALLQQSNKSQPLQSYITNAHHSDTLFKKATDSIEPYRNGFLHAQKDLHITDYGVGESGITYSISLAKLASKALMKKHYAKLLFRYVADTQPRLILELGTCLGITTAYLAMAQQEGQIHTIEGAEATANEAQSVFDALQLNHITLHKGAFDQVIPTLLGSKPLYDLIWIDGNHRYEPTMHYFQQLLPYLSTQGVFVFHDIFLNREMTRAWEQIKRHPQVTTSIELFEMGWAFIHPHYPRTTHVLFY